MRMIGLCHRHSARVCMALLLVMLIALAQSPITAQQPSSSLTEAATATEPAEDDMVFEAAEALVLSAISSDDVIAAGNTITVQGAQADHLFLAGGEITMASAEVHDLFAAGGKIMLNSGTVTDDVVAAGGDIAALPGFTIGNSAVLSGGTVRVETPVGGDLRASAGEITINTAIAGTARLKGDRISLGPNARIGGDLIFDSKDLKLDPAAVITGRTTRMTAEDQWQAGEVGKGAGQLFLVFGLSILASYFILVLVLTFAAPGIMRSSAAMIAQKPWQSLGIGVLFLLLVPLAIVLLISSVFAAPLAILLLAIAVALTPIGLAVTAFFTGGWLRRLITRQSEPATGFWPRLGWAALGVLLVFLLTLVPLLGIVIWLVAMMLGLGAFTRQAFDRLAT